MDKYEENLLRLNKKIRDLIAQLDTLETKNRKLQLENHVLVEDVAHFRAQYARAEEERMRCKTVLEKEIVNNAQQFEAQALLKKRYNELIQEYVAQNQKLKSFEQNANTKKSRLQRKQVRVEIVGKLSDGSNIKPAEDKMATLENRCSVLEKQLRKAYSTIDDLEFELESIDHLENTNDRLEQQNRDLTAQLNQYRSLPLSPGDVDSMTSPLRQVSFHPFESPQSAQQITLQEGSEPKWMPVLRFIGT
ncbi:myosin-13-like [Anopheles nili]|uniref:myosin-13-like n=1 Tax=Anopheles nili TaxID=185578 RepID=UPI00237A466E|nr:myosin-13-like [Anopheles nili]